MAGKAAAAPAPVTISKLGRTFGLARSTLLYYDRIGLLRPTGRTRAGYRIYAAETVERLKRISELRSAGLPLESVKRVLNSSTPLAEALERQLASLNQEIAELRARQRVVLALLQSPAADKRSRSMSKAAWTRLFRAIGMSEEDMRQWHARFEETMPEAHRDFLESLGLDAAEVRRIREWCTLR